MTKRQVGVLALALVSIALLYYLSSYGGLTWSSVSNSISDIGWTIFVWVTVLTGANLALGTLKWLLVLRAFAPNSETHPRFVDGMLTTTIGALLGQVMPVQLGVALTRSLAGKLGIGASPGLNLGTTAYEQLFDALVLCMAGVVGLIGLLLRPGWMGWLALILFVCCIGPLVLGRLGRLLSGLPEWISKTRLAGGRAAKLADAAARATQLSPQIFLQLTILSVIRYLTILTRSVVVLSALGMSAFAIPVILAFPLVQVISILPLTPGNLGVIEWTWSGVLVYAGAAANAAVLFAVSIRVINIAAQMVMLCVFSSLRLMPRTFAA